MGIKIAPLIFALLLCSPSSAEQWTLLGPNGGDVRSLAYDPRNPDHVFLGTSTGTIFASINDGASWSRLAHLGRDDYVIDHIVIDPSNPSMMFAAVWSVEGQGAGNVFGSRDGGTTWTALSDMRDKSVRTLAMAPSDPNVLAAGTLDGVYLSSDGGDHWQRISSENHGGLKNIESVAIDPNNPHIIYAGTWHLAWKTTDGGINWHQIHQGMIDDSDVFSIIVDLTNPSLVYASACSGIYKSESAGEVFHKVDGIPFAARRTRVLKQDPTNHAVVYAGTTQGLWKTIDAGKTWKQLTDSAVVVNDILVDPRKPTRLFLATDRGGVMVSEDGGVTVLPSNSGYTHRYVTTVLPDKNDPNVIFVGVANDHEWGGVFSLRQGGSWQQRSTGLGGRDVFALAQTSEGTLVAGTNRGLFTLIRGADAWRPVTISDANSRTMLRRGLNNISLNPPSATKSLMGSRVNDIEVASRKWLAASSVGVFISADNGRSWNGGLVQGRRDFISVRSADNLLAAATRTEILVSTDDGTNWQLANLPSQLTRLLGLTLMPEGEMLVVSPEGAFRSSNFGQSWEHVGNGLPDRNLSSILYDPTSRTLFATSLSSGPIFQSHDGGRSWSRGSDLGYPLRRVTTVNGRLLAITPFDGIIAQQ